MAEVRVYATKESDLDIWDSYTKTGLILIFWHRFAAGIVDSGRCGSDLWDEIIVLDYAADEKPCVPLRNRMRRCLWNRVFHWRTVARHRFGGRVWLVGRTNSGDAMLGPGRWLPTDLTATTSWAGVTLGTPRSDARFSRYGRCAALGQR